MSWRDSLAVPFVGTDDVSSAEALAFFNGTLFSVRDGEANRSSGSASESSRFPMLGVAPELVIIVRLNRRIMSIGTLETVSAFINSMTRVIVRLGLLAVRKTCC